MISFFYKKKQKGEVGFNTSAPKNNTIIQEVNTGKEYICNASVVKKYMEKQK